MTNELKNRPNNQAKPEHETHTSTLIILTLITAVVALAIFLYAQPQESPQLDNRVQRQAQDTNPVTYQRAEPVDKTNDIPSGLFFGDFELVQNRKLDTGSRQQRIVIYDTEYAPSLLLERLRMWLVNTGYEITSSSTNQGGGSFVADRGGDQLTIVFSGQSNADTTRVQLSYID